MMKRSMSPDPSERLRFYGWTERLVIPELGNCWEWAGPGHKNRQMNYGNIRFNKKWIQIHRLAYETWVGPIPEGLIVRHKCDNPPCMNPDHLEIGTHRDNFNDMVKRGRYASSTKRKAAKISEQEVVEIRDEYSRGVLTQKMIGEIYGVSDNMVSQIVNRVYWRNVP